jgi:hypothetical protein
MAGQQRKGVVRRLFQEDRTRPTTTVPCLSDPGLQPGA